MDSIKNQIKNLEQEVIDLRRDFHMYPELGFQEFKSAEKVEAYLQNLGFKTKRVAKTGVVALLDSGKPGHCLMLRADMDALPVTEENQISYKSRNEGIMHACGHDAHMAMLLVAAKVLADNTTFFKGKIKFIFQPNEEVAGAVKMIEEGVLENPKVDAAAGIHIWSLIPSGRLSITPGVVMGGLDVFKMRIKGRGGHTGYPYEAIDPVITAASIIQSVQIIQTREMDAQKPVIIMFGKINAGKKANIIPEEVLLEGTIRFLHAAPPDSENNPTKKFIRICKSVCETHQCTCDIKIEHENIPLINDDNMVTLAKDTAVEVFDSTDIIDHARYIAGEDFSEFSTKVPGVFIFLGCANPEKQSTFPHHNPKFNIDEDVLTKGVELHVKTAFNYLNNPN
ncbi:MAG: amidohydrolase [Deltaproteobacteria bacterium]|nr:amidohydrolase [Deltaproteobacteria bacterium]